MLQWIHPTFVHFVIGLLLAGVIFDVLGLARTNEKLMFAGYWNTVAGSVAALLALGTGLYAEANLGPHSQIGDALLEMHKLFGFIVLGLSVILAVWRASMKGYMLPRRRTLYLTLAFFSSFVILVTGLLGGGVVYMYGLGIPAVAAQRVIDAQPKLTPKVPTLTTPTKPLPEEKASPPKADRK